MLFLLGNGSAQGPAESGTLKRLLALLAALQAGDPTLEFKNALTPERLFLDKYPDLASDFRPVALGLSCARVRATKSFPSNFRRCIAVLAAPS